MRRRDADERGKFGHAHDGFEGVAEVGDRSFDRLASLAQDRVRGQLSEQVPGRSCRAHEPSRRGIEFELGEDALHEGHYAFGVADHEAVAARRDDRVEEFGGIAASYVEPPDRPCRPLRRAVPVRHARGDDEGRRRTDTQVLVADLCPTRAEDTNDYDVFVDATFSSSGVVLCFGVITGGGDY